MNLERKILILTALLSLPTAALGIASVGTSVSKIPFADQISAFETLDAQHLVVSLGDTHNYVLRLKIACYQLSYATNVAVSMASNTIWAGFDYVTADGWQCPIDSIHKVTAQELERLKS
ncbi:MAG: DUF6491 family protein [Pseudomonadales bacterium]|jgi:hypothetical protein|nr:DUF6491 family protein [Pseudomonadales bacterium]MDP6471864.1 DUF6491 family protein [Pseudomonadales bacterium]MDP6826866.1 DUF6491 family protein [Pseudomonadales bacterium]MDP6970856.1 DUF6491 family protein [Pseudomonadales bacterium]|tara:strand:+ start:489 stop:845 length:357 start_codon:yes stop_codon:yes gene_type:complete